MNNYKIVIGIILIYSICFPQGFIRTIPATVKDADGNIYAVIKIGKQLWTVENLKTTSYNEGTIIPKITENSQWEKCTSGAYCCYENKDTNKLEYGLLYNWYAVNSGKLAPKGWRIPSDTDWEILKEYLITQGYNWDGTVCGDDNEPPYSPKRRNKIAKSLASTTDWLFVKQTGCTGNDKSKNNLSKFSALPGGYRYACGTFYGRKEIGAWWSSSEDDSAYAIYFNAQGLGRPNCGSECEGCGFSVRLVQDLR